MNAINGAVTSLFNLLLTPLEAVSKVFALIVVSGVFGVLALVVFKHISSQKGIKAAKDKIKGHMIEIRLYQDDLALVGKAIVKVLLRNLQYVALNFGPFIPLMIPFGLVAAQMVVRYGYKPVPVTEQPAALLAGEGITLKIELDAAHKREASDLKVSLPEGVQALSPLVRVPAEGLAYQELVATADGAYDLSIEAGGEKVVKTLYAGNETPRYFQPERTASPLMAILWPAEKTLSAPFKRISLGGLTQTEAYVPAKLGWLPGEGPMAVLLWFVVFSMIFGFAALKPLGVEI